jgi:hypothetical protein
VRQLVPDVWRLSGFPPKRDHATRRILRPKGYLSSDPATNRDSARRLVAPEPKLTLFGHGAPLRDTTKPVDSSAACRSDLRGR